MGLGAEALEEIALADGVEKLSLRDLGPGVASGRPGATTVAATAHVAALAGIAVFATGGLGGVHRGASSSFDESADLAALASCAVVVVCAGVKSILDVGRHAGAARDPVRPGDRLPDRPPGRLLPERRGPPGAVARRLARRGRRDPARPGASCGCPRRWWWPTRCPRTSRWTPPCTSGCSPRPSRAAEAGRRGGQGGHALRARALPRGNGRRERARQRGASCCATRPWPPPSPRRERRRRSWSWGTS